MKLERLVCLKCGNIEEFRVDVSLSIISTMLEFTENGASLDISMPDDIEIMCPTCAKCGSDIDKFLPNFKVATPHILCPSCKFFIDGILIETCAKQSKYPDCFEWKNENPVEVDFDA